MIDNSRNDSDKSQSILDEEVSSLLSNAADCELVEMYVSSNSRAAVETLIRRHAPMVAGVIRRVIPKSSDADDAFQATFLILLKSAKKIRKHSSVSAWLYGVAYRTACRARLRLHGNKTVDVDSTSLASQDYRDPLTRISEQFQLELLDRELQQLSSPIKETLIDHHLLGYTASQIADRMDVSVSAVEGRLRRGRAALRHALSRRGISFSVAVALAAKYQSTCVAASSSTFNHLIQADWFGHAIHNTSHLSVPKSLHSLASKDIATMTKTLLPKFGLASAIAACSVAAISTPILLTAPSGRPFSSIMIGSANAQESQASEIAFDGVTGSAGGGGGSSGALGPAGAGDSGFGEPIPAGGGGGFGTITGGGPSGAGGFGGGLSSGLEGEAIAGGALTGAGGSAAPGGLGGSSGGSAYGGGLSGGPGFYGGSGGQAPTGGPGATYGAGSTGAVPSGYVGGLPGAGAPPTGLGGYGGMPGSSGGGGYGGPAGPGGPGTGGMGVPGMPGAPTGPGGMLPGMGGSSFGGGPSSGGGMGGGSDGSTRPRTYVRPASKKPDWLTRGEDTVGEVEQAREAIRARLRTKISPEFNGTPLPSVLSQLSELSSISIGTTLADFEAAGITSEEPVTLGNMSEVSLGRALEIILGSLGDQLTYVIESEGIQIVNKGSDRAKQRRFYDLSYIVSDEDTFDHIQELIDSSFRVDVSSIGPMLMITADEPQHLKIEELLSQLARMPKENL